METVITWFFYGVAFFLLNLIAFAVLSTIDVMVKNTVWEIPFKPFKVIFAISDWIANWTVIAVWMWQLPESKYELVTARLKRYKALYRDNVLDDTVILLNAIPVWTMYKWRYVFAVTTCAWLSKWDAEHC